MKKLYSEILSQIGENQVNERVRGQVIEPSITSNHQSVINHQ